MLHAGLCTLQANTMCQVREEASLCGADLISLVDRELQGDRFQECRQDFITELR